MGEAKRKQKRRAAFLTLHPMCVYCGRSASTTDHCPPRCFFEQRQWPATYEFPSCEQCNSEARLDEQALAVLIRSRLTDTPTEISQREWEKLVDGIKNNQPHLLAEWMNVTRNELKRNLRTAFGRTEGDRLRNQGWGVVNVGTITQELITRFSVKLGKALYYKHNSAILDGVIYAHHIDLTRKNATPEYFNDILRLAPSLALVERNRQSLSDQFTYRFNSNAEAQVMYAIVQFGDQFVFQIIALGKSMHAKLVELNGGNSLSTACRHECFLDVNLARQMLEAPNIFRS